MGSGIGGHTAPNKGATDSWVTPRGIIDALGPFDLDPCACTPQPWPCARMSYTVADDGLQQPWAGSVFLNPPYSDAATWLYKLAEHGNGIALIFARTETAMFAEFCWGRASAMMFLHGRLVFHLPDGSRAKGNAGGPSVLVAFGRKMEARLLSCGLPGSIVSGWRNL